MHMIVKFVILVYFVLPIWITTEAAKVLNNVKKRQGYEYHPKLNRYESSESSHSESHSHYDEPITSPKKGYSAGSGLRSIAQGSANQAHTAVANQHAAAKQAAYIAKSTLAQSAIQAAATAQAALAGKEVLLQSLEQQSADARRALEASMSQLQQAKQSAKASQQTAQAAYNHVSLITTALNSAKSLADHADAAANEAASELATQTSMVGQAKVNLESIEEQLKSARIDYGATKEAAIKASSSASEAQANAAKAASHATLELHGVVSASDHKDDYENDGPLVADIDDGGEHDSLDEH